jgi:dephospho-CoA kinase
MKTLAIGVTGGIGSGKTEVCKIFSSMRAPVLFADSIAKEIINSNKSVKAKIQIFFGKDIYDSKTINRREMAELIFADKRKKEILNRIVHPVVINKIEKLIRATKQEKKFPLLFIEAALIYEAGTESLFDYIIAVDSEERQRIQRIMLRDNLSRTEVDKRFNAQLPANAKIKKADFVIQNSGTMETLNSTCKIIFNLLSKIAYV